MGGGILWAKFVAKLSLYGLGDSSPSQPQVKVTLVKLLPFNYPASPRSPSQPQASSGAESP